ncbi:sigma-70 family RNA polymerase sigma factor [Streptomyces sp. NPDC046716]|uniref:sigma-70 family RNA polymerase sigma factor n=1 Tax=Streptomyces sp. NPDC046716 TaxID=3157093 RepID=UPI0033EA5E01
MRTARTSSPLREATTTPRRTSTHPHAGPAPSDGGMPPAEPHRARLLRYVLRLTSGDAHRAEDIVQETMLRAWLSWDRGVQQDDEHRQAWLFTVARNLAVDAHRRERCIPVGAVPEPLLTRPGGTDMADNVVNRRFIAQAMARLSLEHREVLARVHLVDESGEDTARALGVPKGTVKSRTHYALRALRREVLAA